MQDKSQNGNPTPMQDMPHDLTASSAPQETESAPAHGIDLPVAHLTVEDILRWHSVPYPLIDALAGASLAEGLEQVLNFTPLQDAVSAPLAFGGASGSGKTLVLAKLAAQNALNGTPPLIIACDHNAGSLAKLSALVQPFNIEVVVARTPENVAAALNARPEGQPVLCDLPGICVYSALSMSKMMQMVDILGADLSLVLPAGLDAEESADIGEMFAECGATTMVASKMDQAGRVGGIIAAAACGLSLTYGSCSSNIVGGLVSLNPTVLARRLLTLPT
ncbi:flagellar GTP-binding protein [Acetobacter orientalis NRIC 0481]|mgnify:CR=1 FL=1|nr:flagellar GTP-binding protein [Acetobacter orientalis NRIC 0481]